MQKTILLLAISFVILSCGNQSQNKESDQNNNQESAELSDQSKIGRSNYAVVWTTPNTQLVSENLESITSEFTDLWKQDIIENAYFDKESTKDKVDQFPNIAFFTFPSVKKNEQHPFTISSHPYNENLRITVKGLGDYSNNLSQKLNVGDSAFVEGSYGHFSSSYIKEKEQVWIAGGIGITPFLSLAKDMYTNKVNLIWCVKEQGEAVYSEELESLAKENVNFSFTIWASEDCGYLTAEELGVDEYESKGYLICGPDSLKESMMNQLKEKGVKNQNMYEEEFAFR